MADKIVSQFNILHNSLDESLSFNENRYNQKAARPGGALRKPGIPKELTPAQLAGVHIELMGVGRTNKPDFYECTRCERFLPGSQFGLLRSVSRKVNSYFVLSGKCNTCRKDLRSEFADHPLLTPNACRALRRTLKNAGSAPELRGLVCCVDAEDIFALWIVQGGRCALSDMPMVCHETPLKDWNAPSIDRIDSNDNYTINNVQLVCWAVNMMKSNMSVRELKRWCAAIIKKDITDAAALLGE